MLDYRHRLFPAASDHPDIVTIVIDDDSLDQIGRWPWPRRYLAHLVSTCHEAGAKQVVLDIVMPEEQSEEALISGVTDYSFYEPNTVLFRQGAPQIIDNDAALYQALNRSGNVLLAFFGKLEGETFEREQKPDDKESLALSSQVHEVLRANPEWQFSDTFSYLWPTKDFSVRDPSYHKLLREYLRSKAKLLYERYGFMRAGEDVAIPIISLEQLTPPFLRFAEANVLDSGFVSSKKDSDGVVRRMPLLGRYKDRLYKQLALASACQVLGVREEDIDLSHPDQIILGQPNIVIPLEEDGQMIIAWTGADWRDKLNTSYVPATQILQVYDLEQAWTKNNQSLTTIRQGWQKMGVDEEMLRTIPNDLSGIPAEERKMYIQLRQQLGIAEQLRRANLDLAQQTEQAKQTLHDSLGGKIVLVGSVATGAPDFVVTPHSKLTPGIVVHRNVLNTILQEAFIYRMPRSTEILIILLLGTLMTVIAGISRPLVSGLALLLLAPATVGMNFWIGFGLCHYWIAVVSPVAAILASFTAVTFYREVTEGRAKRRITARFKQYAPPTVVDRIVSTASQVSLAGEKRELSCFFSDLAGFTSISEKLGPEKTVSVLNIYLDRMTEVLDRYYATINKFEGDGIFAFFGAPVEPENQAKLACLAAIDTQKELAKLVDEQRKSNPEFPSLQKRVGISTGEAVVGDCGSHRRFDYTAIGDTVNLGARLESANKAFGSKMMICETTFQKAVNAIEARYLGRVRVVGKEKGVGIYELCGVSGEIDDPQKTYNEQFAGAVRFFQERQFDKAVQGFETCLQVRPDEKAAILYLRTCRHIVTEGIPSDFSGGIELTEK